MLHSYEADWPLQESTKCICATKTGRKPCDSQKGTRWQRERFRTWAPFGGSSSRHQGALQIRRWEVPCTPEKHLHWSNRLQDSFKIWFPWSHSQTVKRIWLITITFHQATKYVHSGPCPIWTSAVADPDSVGPPKIYRGLLRIRSVNRSQYFFNKYPHLNISIQAWCSVEDSNSTMIPHVWAYPGLEGILRHSQGKLKI